MVTAIKGFNADMTCRGFQFEPGGEYQHDGRVEACSRGFHAVPDDTHPLTVLQFYAPAGSRYFRVECSGEIDRAEDKIASEIMRVSTDEISLHDLTIEAVKWVMDRSHQEGEIASGYQGAATASGDHGAATASGARGAATASGYQGAATASGTRGAATASGYQGAATASGTQGAATASGTQGAATASGYQGAATASGYQGAATASGTRGAATASGYQGAATASGYQGAATASGTRGAATASGTLGCAVSTGPDGMVRGDIDGIDLFAREIEWDGDKYVRKSIACGTTGENGIEAGVWYRCVAGRLVEADHG